MLRDLVLDEAEVFEGEQKITTWPQIGTPRTLIKKKKKSAKVFEQDQNWKLQHDCSSTQSVNKLKEEKKKKKTQQKI